MATNRLRKFRSKSIERCTGYEKKNCESCTATSVAEGKHDVGVSGVQHESARFAISEPTASVVRRHVFTGCAPQMKSLFRPQVEMPRAGLIFASVSRRGKGPMRADLWSYGLGGRMASHLRQQGRGHDNAKSVHWKPTFFRVRRSHNTERQPLLRPAPKSGQRRFSKAKGRSDQGAGHAPVKIGPVVAVIDIQMTPSHREVDLIADLVIRSHRSLPC